MKTSILLAAIALTLSGTAFAAGGHDHSPKHGGVVAEAKDMDYELVAKPAAIQLHLRDADRRSVDGRLPRPRRPSGALPQRRLGRCRAGRHRRRQR